jgi:hypothetical protein
VAVWGAVCRSTSVILGRASFPLWLCMPGGGPRCQAPPRRCDNLAERPMPKELGRLKNCEIRRKLGGVRATIVRGQRVKRMGLGPSSSIVRSQIMPSRL